MTAAQDARPQDVIDEPETGPLLVPAETSLQEQRPRTLKHGDTFAVYDHNGDVISGPAESPLPDAE